MTALPLTKAQDEFVLGCHGDNVRSLKIVEQHLQAKQLDGGKGNRHLDTGVQIHPRRTGRAVKACSACNRKTLACLCVLTGLALQPNIIFNFEIPDMFLLSSYSRIPYIIAAPYVILHHLL